MHEIEQTSAVNFIYNLFSNSNSAWDGRKSCAYSLFFHYVSLLAQSKVQKNKQKTKNKTQNKTKNKKQKKKKKTKTKKKQNKRCQVDYKQWKKTNWTC